MNSLFDAEVNQFSFLKCLCHCMDGNKIRNVYRNAVEWTILFEVETLMCNLGTMRVKDMEDRILGKYVNIVCDILDDQHFESNLVHNAQEVQDG